MATSDARAAAARDARAEASAASAAAAAASTRGGPAPRSTSFAAACAVRAPWRAAADSARAAAQCAATPACCSCASACAWWAAATSHAARAAASWWRWPAHACLITLDYVLRKGTQSNGRGKQARICVLCDAFCSHTALPRVKGVHQPRDSAVSFSKQTATATAGCQRASVEQVSTDGEGRRRGEAVVYILPSPFFARLCDTAGRQSFAQHSPPPEGRHTAAGGKGIPRHTKRHCPPHPKGGAVHTAVMRPPCRHPSHSPLPGSLSRERFCGP